MKVLVIEDEELAAEKLISTLKDIDPEINILGATESVQETLEWLQKNESPDLIFSDIHLADGLCFDIFKEGIVECPVVFTTAYDHYAIRAFDVNSIAYLLKPIQKEQLKESLEKFTNLKDKFTPHDPHQLDRLVDIIQKGSSNYKSRFLVKVGQKIKSIPAGKIAYFYTKEKLNFIVTTSGDKYPVDHTLEEVDVAMDPKCFFRVNRKFVVNIESVKEIHPYFKGRLKIQVEPDPDSAEEIVISSDKTPAFKEWLDQ